MNSKTRLRHVVILSGGIGRRFNAGKPKQLAMLGKHPVIYHSVQAFSRIRHLGDVIVVCHPDWLDETRKIFKNYPVSIRFIPGGTFRQDSSRAGVDAINGLDSDVVLIHDAARPLVSEVIIERVIEAAITAGAAIPVIPAADTLVQIEENIITDYLDRTRIHRVQTPQGFILERIRKAHRHAIQTGMENATDDATLVHHSGYPVATVAGEPSNIKITNPNDAYQAISLMKNRNFREGEKV